MERIKTKNRAVDLFGPGKDGFRSAVPGVSEPTYLSAEFFNDLQESLMRVIERAGMAPAANYEQLVDAIKSLVSTGATQLLTSRYPSVIDYGANPDGVTSSAEAFAAIEGTDGLDSIYVPAGVYRSQAAALRKTYFGPGVILFGNGAAYDANGVNGGLGDVNVGSVSDPRTMVLLADSIGFAFGVTPQESWYGQLQKRLGRKMPRGLGDYISGSCLDRMVLVSGPALLPGLSGPLGGNPDDPGAKIFRPGTKTATLATNADFVQFWYWQQPGAGTITVRDAAGRVVGVQDCAGVNDPVHLSSAMPVVSSADTLYTFECSGAPVEMNGLMISPLILDGDSTPLVLMAHFKGGFGTKSFISDAVIDAIVAQTPYRPGFTSFILALGTNDIYNLFGQAVSAAEYGANLVTIITKLKNRMSCTFDIIVPLRPDGVYRVIEEFDHYRREAYQAARATGSRLIDASVLDLISTGSYLPDKLHPTAIGHAIYADFYDSATGLSRLDVAPYRGPVQLLPGVTPLAYPYGVPVARMTAGGDVQGCGAARVEGLAKGTYIAIQAKACAPRYRKLFAVPGFSPGYSVAVLLYEPDGRIMLFDYNGATCDNVDFSSVRYNIYD